MRRLACIVGMGVVLCLAGDPAVIKAGQKRQMATAIPSGTTIEVRLNNQLDTGETQAGQAFTGTVAQPVVVGGKTLLAKGATVKGRVAEVVSSGRLKRPASITLALTSVSTQPLQIDGKSHLLRNVALIGGGAGAGALLGGIAGGKKGAAIGTAIGAGAGTATAYMTGKQEIVLPAETVLPFVAGTGAAAASPTAGARTEVAHAAAPAPLEAHAAEPAGGAGQVVQVVFTNRDQEMIRNYYSGGRGLPPGLAKKGKLPPGLAKQLRRNGSLPPGLQKKYGAVPFPPDLARQLPPVPSGYSRLLIAGRAVLTDRNHNVLDIMAIIH